MKTKKNVSSASSKVSHLIESIPVFLLVYVCQVLKVWPTDTTVRAELEQVLRCGLRSQNAQLKGPGVLASVGCTSPFRDARPNLSLHTDFPYPKPTYSIRARFGAAVLTGNMFGSVNRPQISRRYQEMYGILFRVRLSPWN